MADGGSRAALARGVTQLGESQAVVLAWGGLNVTHQKGVSGDRHKFPDPGPSVGGSRRQGLGLHASVAVLEQSLWTRSVQLCLLKPFVGSEHTALLETVVNLRHTQAVVCVSSVHDVQG